MKQAKGGHWNLGILRGDSGGDLREYWGLRPQYWLICPHRIIPQDSQVPVSTPGLFHTLDIHTLPSDSAAVRPWKAEALQGLIRPHKPL